MKSPIIPRYGDAKEGKQSRFLEWFSFCGQRLVNKQRALKEVKIYEDWTVEIYALGRRVFPNDLGGITDLEKTTESLNKVGFAFRYCLIDIHHTLTIFVNRLCCLERAKRLYCFKIARLKRCMLYFRFSVFSLKQKYVPVFPPQVLTIFIYMECWWVDVKSGLLETARPKICDKGQWIVR